jgi:signal transduction histidine kinase
MLEASNRELDVFAGRVAHDLRNPLSTAALATSRLSRQSPSPEQIKTFDVIHRSFGRMTAIIEDLLAISRIQGSAPVASDPAAAAQQVREELEPRVEGGDVSLLVDVQPARVRCSEGLLRQVMWNLADNALKYRRPEVRSRVEICGRAADGRYELSVGDNGVGISPDETGKVFAPFYRGAGETRPPGTGLGLSIVKRAVEANGGTVSVTSMLGRGSTFVARLPLA